MITNILSTSSLSPALLSEARTNGIELDAVPFIQVCNIEDKELEEEVTELRDLPVNAVFTSANAVKSVARFIGNIGPAWVIYCIGNATKNEVLKYFDLSKIKGTANDAAALAEIIKMDDVSEIVFFCGNNRMETLPGILREDGVLVYDVIVYETKEVPVVITKRYDGILFFSPSGVRSFFSANITADDTILFAIGNTTAEAIKGYAGVKNKVVICTDPSKEQVVAEAIHFFSKRNIIKK